MMNHDIFTLGLLLRIHFVELIIFLLSPCQRRRRWVFSTLSLYRSFMTLDVPNVFFFILDAFFHVFNVIVLNVIEKR